jgi:hypothetical protein
MDASNKFGNYKPEEKQIVRPAEVIGDELEQLRRKREMLRSMTPEQAFSVIEFHERLDFFEALALAKREGKIIVPNDVHDRIQSEMEAYSAWTGTFVIYEAPDKPFGEKVVYGWEDGKGVGYSIRLAVPENFRGKRNCSLVVEHPDFDLVSLGNNLFELKADGLNLLENFPKEPAKWYKFDEGFRIPVGSQKRKNKSLRRLWRLDDSYLGPVARDFDDLYYDLRRDAYLYYRPSGGYGVALF